MSRRVSHRSRYIKSQKVSTASILASTASFKTLTVNGKEVDVSASSGAVVSNTSTPGDFKVNGKLTVVQDVRVGDKIVGGADGNGNVVMGDPNKSLNTSIRPMVPIIMEPVPGKKQYRMQALQDTNNNNITQFQIQGTNTPTTNPTNPTNTTVELKLYTDSQTDTGASFNTEIKGGARINGDLILGTDGDKKDLFCKKITLKNPQGHTGTDGTIEMNNGNFLFNPALPTSSSSSGPVLDGKMTYTAPDLVATAPLDVRSDLKMNANNIQLGVTSTDKGFSIHADSSNGGRLVIDGNDVSNSNGFAPQLTLYQNAQNASTTNNCIDVLGTTVFENNLFVKNEMEVQNGLKVTGADFKVTHTSSGSTSDTFKVIGESGNTDIKGDLKVNTDKFVVTASTGNTDIKGDLKVNTDNFTVAASTGNTVIKGTATIAEKVDAKKGLDVTGGALTVAGDKFSVDNSTGNTVIKGTATIEEKVDAKKGLDVTGGALTVTNSVAGNTFSVDPSTGDLKVNMDKFVVTGGTGATVIKGKVDAKAGLDVTGGALTVTNSVAGNTFSVDPSTGDLKVNTDKFTIAASSGNTVIKGTATIAEKVDAKKGLDVTGGALTTDQAITQSGTGQVTFAGEVHATNGLDLPAKPAALRFGGTSLSSFVLETDLYDTDPNDNSSKGRFILKSNGAEQAQLTLYEIKDGQGGGHNWNFGGPVRFGKTVKFLEAITVQSTQYTSDDRVKHNEAPIQNATQTLKKVKVYDYDQSYEMKDANFNGDMKDVPHFKMSGVIAQQVFTEVPELKHLVKEGSDTVPYSFNYMGMVAYLIKSAQEMSTDLSTAKQERANAVAATESLRAEVESLKKMQTDLIARIETLENKA